MLISWNVCKTFDKQSLRLPVEVDLLKYAPTYRTYFCALHEVLKLLLMDLYSSVLYVCNLQANISLFSLIIHLPLRPFVCRYIGNTLYIFLPKVLLVCNFRKQIR
uniref:Uncharacterized protein n=1 Tax=Cacopsylla melanoneura TaxID=428564 RepID=A0A8D8WJ86_9HEMI